MIEGSSLKDAQTLIKTGVKKLSSVSNVPRLEAEILLSNLLESNPIKFPPNELTVSQRLGNNFEALIESRFKGMPVAYLVGKKEFWSMEFDINPSVLVPRPETELLIEQAVEVLGNHQSPRILELGTGSGIISIVLSKELREPIITATDVSHEALIVAKNNADKHNSNDINFILSNWFDTIDNDKFDLIISNPPYVDKSKLTNKELFGIDKLNLPRSSVPAITHIDYSARIQTVHEDTNSKYHAVISKFKEKTGCPLVVNTSFNVRGEPIICSPEDAFKCFMGTELDVLALSLIHI